MLHADKEYSPILPLAIFRIGFGALMFISVLRTVLNGWVHELYIDPVLHFQYFGFSWLPYPTEFHIYALFGLALLSALGLCLGYYYRLSAILFFCSFTYIELLDVSYYLNHYYFVSLVAFALIFLPAERALSFDVKAKEVEPTALVPRWHILLPRVLVGGLYFMAGIAKLNEAWLVEALPLRIWLPAHNDIPFVGPLFSEPWLAFLFSWFGAAFDLSVPFLLSWKRSRKLAYGVLVIFHVLTWLLFPIGMFPWVMIVSALVFFEADDWPSSIANPTNSARLTPSKAFNVRFKLASTLLLFALFLFPFRYLCYPSNLYWHEQGYRFSWRVMLMEKAGQAFFYVQDPKQPGKKEIINSDFLTPFQEKQMSTQPDLILQYAHFLEKHFKEQGITDPIVTVKAYVSLNGKGSRLLVDPERDLSKIEDSWKPKDWLLPFERSLAPNNKGVGS